MILGLDPMAFFLLGLAGVGVIVALMVKWMDRNAGKAT